MYILWENIMIQIIILLGFFLRFFMALTQLKNVNQAFLYTCQIQGSLSNKRRIERKTQLPLTIQFY